MSRRTSNKSIILWSISLILLLGLWLVSLYAEDYLEKRLKVKIDEAYPNLCQEVDLGLLSRSVELKLVDTAKIQARQHQVVIHKGNIQMKGISWRKLFLDEQLRMKRLNTSMTFASVRSLRDNETKEHQDSSNFDISLEVGEVGLVSDSLWIQDEQVFTTGKTNISFTDVHYSDSLNYTLSSIRVLGAGSKDAKDRRWSAGELQILEDSLVVSELRVVDKEPSTIKRLYINGSVDRLVAMGSIEKLWRDNLKMDSLFIEGFSFQLDELGQRKRCDGQVPCIKKHMSHVLLDLPVKQYISATGGLAYRYYKGDRIESEFTVYNADLAINYDASSDQAADADRLSFDVNALFNRAIPVAWSGNFDRGENFDYTVTTESFSLQELNPLLPKFEGYSIAIASGNCDQLKMAVSGRHTQSTSRMWISYDNFKLDIKKDESLGTKLLDWASRTFVNNNHDSEEAFVRKINYDKKYSFFYQLGDHLNNSCQAVMVENWAQRFL